MKRWVNAVGMALAVWSVGAVAAPPFAWVEGESPKESNFDWKATNWPGNERFSGGNWLHTERKPIGDEGLQLSYEVTLPADGNYQVWLRMGYEWVRPVVSWQLDDGPTTTVGLCDTNELPAGERERAAALKVDFNRRTTNVKGLQSWVEIGWWPVGEVRASAGTHALRLTFRRSHLADPVCALDAICLVAGDWVPEGALRPGEAYGAEADRQAAEHVFALPPPGPDAQRVSLPLTGLWQAARYDDPDMAVDPHAPIPQLPSPDDYPLRWAGVQVPGPLGAHGEMGFAHRAVYRTRVHVPAEHKGRGFALRFTGTSWLASVFVNGRLAGTHRTVQVPWELDVTPYVTAGADNEIAVAIKGPYYAMDVASMQTRGSLNYLRNRPVSHIDSMQWFAPIYPSGKGGINGLHWGLVGPVTLTSAGGAYIEDVFVKTSVARKHLEADVTVRNTTGLERTLGVATEAVLESSGQVEKRFGPVPVTVPAGGTVTVAVSGDWSDPKLWWPEDKPELYRLRTSLVENGAAVDRHEQVFGFREVALEGTGITVNGLRRNFWNWVTVGRDGGEPRSPDELATQFRAQKNRLARLDETIHGPFPTRAERLAFYDRTGIPGRLCTAIDGMFINYTLALKKDDQMVLNEPVWEGFREHLVQTARAYRNHPSILMYQAENELVFINGQNRYGPAMEEIQAAMAEAIEAARAVDPTRPFQVGGGGDLGGRIETLCTHYASSVDTLGAYPENAYTLATSAQSSRRWPWLRDKPYISGEDSFQDTEEYSATVLGDETFRSAEDAERGKAKYLRMLYGGYRWAGVAAFHPWCNLHTYEDADKVFDDLYIVPRKQTHRLLSGSRGELLFKACNDTWSREPLELAWTWSIGGKVAARGNERLKVEPGHAREFTVVIDAPETDTHLNGTLSLESRQGAKIYRDERLVSVLPRVATLAADVPVALLDRSGRIGPFLDAAGVAYTTIKAPDELRGRQGVAIVGPDSLTPAEALGNDLLLFAMQGGRVLVLEQESPVSGGNLPVPMHRSENIGGYAHPQALGTEVFRDLDRHDLIDWAGDHPTFKKVYFKPSKGARSLAQAGDKLQYSPLVELPCGNGIMLLCQLRIGAKLGVEPAAAILFRNLVERCVAFRPATRGAALLASDATPMMEAVGSMGLRTERVALLQEALDAKRFAAVTIDASPANLSALVGMEERVKRFQAEGGWVMLTGLEPEGLEAFNRLLGSEHWIRRFRLERVTLERPNHPLAATLGNRDLFYRSTRDLGWGRTWISWHTYRYVIDGRNIATFARLPGTGESLLDYTPTFDDKDPYNLVNGMFTRDHWRYSRQLWNPDPEQPPPATEFLFSRPEDVAEIRVWNNATYSTIAELDVIFDDDADRPVRIEMPDDSGLASAHIDPPRRVERSLKLQPRRMRLKPASHQEGSNLYGFDNVEILRPEKVTDPIYLDNVGGLVVFPRGRGGFLLNQLELGADDPNRGNADRKQYVTSVLLQNMGVGAAASAVAVPGLNLRYEPLDITQSCNAYLAHGEGRPGWIFAQRSNPDLSRLPLGEQHFAGVPFRVTDFMTAPVPNCIVAYASDTHARDANLPREVTGIPVNRQADVLFFLHGAQPEALRSGDEGPKVFEDPSAAPVVAQYVLHYADGRMEIIPVQLGLHVERFHVKPGTEAIVRREITRELDGTPLLVPAASVAWSTRAFPDRQGNQEHLAIYSMMVRNPRPDVPIASIDVSQARSPDGAWTRRRNGNFGLIAITTGRIDAP